MDSKENYNCIDLTRIIMAVVVIAIHTNPVYYCTNEFITSTYKAIVNCAVPFFFITQGFFIANVGGGVFKASYF